MLSTGPQDNLHAHRLIMLEELTQILGFPVDIIGHWYEFGSIFSEKRNARISLGKQDMAAIRLHYPIAE